MASLDKFGVPLNNGATQTMKQPRQKNHFRVLFVGFGGNSNAISLETNKVGKPSVSYEKHPVHSYNSVMNYKGKYTWKEIELSVRDTIDNGPFKAIVEQWKKEFDHEGQEARKSASSYKFEMFIEDLDGSNAEGSAGVISGWYIEGCMMTNVNFGDELDYSDSNFSSISITIQPDNCTPVDANRGSLVGAVDKGWLDSIKDVLSL